jgi:hypothetical protein
MVFADGLVDPARIRVSDVIDFVGALTRRYQLGTVELAATAVRSFFRFLRVEGVRGDRLEDGVPTVPYRRSCCRGIWTAAVQSSNRFAGCVIASRVT